MGKVQFIRGSNGEELVVLPRADYDMLLAAMVDEEADEIALYDARKQQLAIDQDMLMPSEVSMMLLKGNSRIKALRRWRGVKQSDLAISANVSQSYLSDIESRRRRPSTDKIAALAKALDVPLAWLA